MRKVPEHEHLGTSAYYEPGTILPQVRQRAIECAKKYRCRVYIRENTERLSQWTVEKFDTHLRSQPYLRTIGYADPNCFVRLVRQNGASK